MSKVCSKKMYFETLDTAAYGMLSVAHKLLTLAKQERSNRTLLMASIVFAATALEAYTNTLIWSRLTERKDQELFEEYTNDKDGQLSLRYCPIREKIKKWIGEITENSIKDKYLLEKLDWLVDLRNAIVHYQVRILDNKQLIDLASGLDFEEDGSKVNDPVKIARSLETVFSLDYLRSEINLEKAQEAIGVAKKVMAELNVCFYNRVPEWLERFNTDHSKFEKKSMPSPTEFQKDYFIQTRREIDTDKKIRDTTLNFAVLVLGATGFALLGGKSSIQLLKSCNGVGLNLSAIIIMTSLFYARRQKMKQIADRWFALYHLLEKNPDWLNPELSMESIVFKGFKSEKGKLQRYKLKDLILNLTFCTPLLLAIFFFNVIIAIAITPVFLAFVCWLHLGTIKDPFDKKVEN